MKKYFLALFLCTHSLFAAEPISASRSAGDYRVTITLTNVELRGIDSIVITHGKERFAFPVSLFDDIQAVHVGPNFKASEFQFDVKRSSAVIRIFAGGDEHPDEHHFCLLLPLKEVSRISRQGDESGYAERRSQRPLSK